MTSYLLMDLDKSALGCVTPVGEGKQVLLFAKKKKNRQLAKDFAAENPQVKLVKVEKDEKLAEVLADKLKKLLKKQPDAHFFIDSPRGKVVKLVDKVLNRFPNASVVVLNIKNVHAGEDNPPPTATENATPADVTASTEIAPKQATPLQPEPNNTPAKNSASKNKKKTINKKPMLLPTHEPKSLQSSLAQSATLKKHFLLDKVSQNHQEKNDDKHTVMSSAFEHLLSRLNDVIGVLTQGYPKKKETLLGELMHILQVEKAEAEAMLENLIGNGMMKVDNANNVKITNLIHLLKLK